MLHSVDEIRVDEEQVGLRLRGEAPCDPEIRTVDQVGVLQDDERRVAERVHARREAKPLGEAGRGPGHEAGELLGAHLPARRHGAREEPGGLRRVDRSVLKRVLGEPLKISPGPSYPGPSQTPPVNRPAPLRVDRSFLNPPPTGPYPVPVPYPRPHP